MKKLLLTFLFLFATNSHAITLIAGQEQFITSGDINETNTHGISSELQGAQGNLNSITNLHNINVGDDSASGLYGIRTTKSFYEIINAANATITTQHRNGRGLSITGGDSIVTNQGSITTNGTNQAYAVFVSKDNNIINNSGNITSVNSRGVSLDGNFNQFTNSGAINAGGVGVYVSAGADLAATNNNFSEINNSGNIISSSYAIHNIDNFSRIENSGNIASSASDGIRNEGNGAQITNSANGEINGLEYAIYNVSDDFVVNNSGTINGKIRLGNGVLNILGGSISGEIDGNFDFNDVGQVQIGSALTNINYTQENNYINLDSLIINAQSSFSSARSLEAQVIEIGNQANFTISNGFSSQASIRGINNNEGTINLSNISYAGNLGANNSALANINIDATSSFTSTSNIFAQNINNFGALNLSENNSTISGNVIINNSASINLKNATHQIAGNFNLNSNAILNSALENNQLGSLEITGDAAISTQAKININLSENNDYIANNTSFQLINSQNQLTQKISDENISVNNNNSNTTGLLRFTSEINNGNLTIVANHLAASEVSQNKNIQNIYNSINSIGALGNDSLREFQNFLNSSNLSIADGEKAINQILPFPTKAQILSTQNIVRNNILISEKRLEELHINANKHKGFWALAFGNNLHQKQVASDEEFTSNSVGIMIGFDKEISENSDIGISFSYNKSDVKVADNSKSNFINSAQINIFSSHNFKHFYLDFIGAMALHDFNQKKNINAINSSSKANYLGNSQLVKINLSKINSLPWQLKFTSKASLSFLRSEIASYEENGGGTLDLKVGKAEANFLEGKIGFDFGKIGKISEIHHIDQLSAIFKLAYLHNIINDKPTTNINFVNYNQSFTQEISQIDESGIQLGFELSAIHDEDVTFTLEYTYEKRKTLESNFLLFKARQAF
jgi:outer membrane autotransporter protein